MRARDSATAEVSVAWRRERDDPQASREAGRSPRHPRGAKRLSSGLVEAPRGGQPASESRSYTRERHPGSSRFGSNQRSTGQLERPKGLMSSDQSPVAAEHDVPFTLSFVVPTYDEEEVLPEFHRRPSAVMNALTPNWQVIYVNDGSVDSKSIVLAGLARIDRHVRVIELSRNFGKEIAMRCHLHAAH